MPLWIIFALNLLLLIAILFTSRVDLLISPGDKKPISISYLIFDFAPKKNGRQRLPNRSQLKALGYLLTRSNVEVNENNNIDDLSLFDSLIFLPRILGRYTLLTILRASAKKFKITCNKNEPFTVKISFSLFAMFITLLKLSYYLLKSKLRRLVNE